MAVPSHLPCPPLTSSTYAPSVSPTLNSLHVCVRLAAGKEALKSGLNIPGVAESYDEGGNLKTARYAKGLDPGQTLL